MNFNQDFTLFDYNCMNLLEDVPILPCSEIYFNFPPFEEQVKIETKYENMSSSTEEESRVSGIQSEEQDQDYNKLVDEIFMTKPLEEIIHDFGCLDEGEL